MKKLTTYILLSSMLVVSMTACKKDEHKVFYEGGTAPVLTASSNTIDLAFANAANNVLKLTWTNPEYQFNTGSSSQDVNYLVEIDVAGNNFNGVNKQTVAVSRDLSASFTVGQFNDYLLNQLLLVPGTQRNIEIRVKASMGTLGAATLISNVLNYAVTPYAIPPKVDPPASGKLYVTGSATPASWMGGGDAEVVAQRFTKISTTLYELPSIALTGGGSMLFVPQYGDWNNKFGFTGSGNGNNVNGDDFRNAGNDILAPAASGNYKIIVDFQRGKFTVTKL